MYCFCSAKFMSDNPLKTCFSIAFSANTRFRNLSHTAFSHVYWENASLFVNRWKSSNLTYEVMWCFIWNMLHNSVIFLQRLFEKVPWKVIYAGDQSSGLSRNPFYIFRIFLFPFPAIASLMLYCFFIGNARKNKPILPQFKCKYDKGIITLSDLTRRVIW